jgi:NitT/TauT family transport system ATP-binding protein
MEGVTHWFREAAKPSPVVVDFNLRVSHHEFVAIIGPSGCGKTTVLNMLAGLFSPEIGRCEIYLDDVPEIRPSTRIGYMFAKDALLPWRNLQRNVELGLEFRKIPRAERRQLGKAAIARVGLAGQNDVYPSKLSHGMRQRGNLARLLVTSPELLFLDEPFAALDAQTKLNLQDYFIKIWEAEKQTVLLVTHDLAEAAALADRVIVMRRGRIVANLPVPLDRPREINDLRSNPQFVRFLESLHELLRDEFSMYDTTLEVVSPEHTTEG